MCGGFFLDFLNRENSWNDVFYYNLNQSMEVEFQLQPL